jgi:hypothetical protein
MAAEADIDYLALGLSTPFALKVVSNHACAE